MVFSDAWQIHKTPMLIGPFNDKREILQQEIETQKQQNQNLEQFIQKIRKRTYAELAELTPYAAHEPIKAIYVGAPDKSSGKRRQGIQICYDLIGFIPLSEPMEQEMA